MKKYFIIAALILVPVMAYAAENLRQKSHGGAVWVQNRDGTTHPAGGVVVGQMTDLISAATHYVMAHKTGNLMKVYTTLQAAVTGDSAISVHTNHSASLGSGESFTTTGHSITITASGSAAGDVDSSVLTAATTATKVSQGDVIAIIGDGGSTAGGAGGITYTLVIE